MRTKDLQIDQSEGATHKYRKTKSGGKWVVDGTQRVGRAGADTQGVEGKRRDETGTLSAEPWVKEYRIRYYLVT